MDTPEREVAEMQEHSDEVGRHIEQAREDFRRKAEQGVPGAQGEAHADEEGRDEGMQAEEDTSGGGGQS